jgi:hypothetical protein
LLAVGHFVLVRVCFPRFWYLPGYWPHFCFF